MKAKYDGVVIQVKNMEDIYHIFDTEDEYNLVHDKTKEIFESYCESTIDYHIQKGNWIVLNKKDKGVSDFTVGDRISFKGKPGTVTYIPPNNIGLAVRFDGDSFDEHIYKEYISSLEFATEDKAESIKSDSALDKQISGTHYKDCAIQPIEYIHANGLDYFEGNAVKYITRHRKKNGKADLEKAIHYLELLIELEYKEE